MEIANQQPLTTSGSSYSILRLVTVCLFACIIAACSTQQNHSNAQHTSINLTSSDLETYGLAFLSPATVTGKEEDKQAVAFIFAKVLKDDRPNIRQVSMPHALGAINNAGLASAYKRMLQSYQTTGIFDQNTLTKIGDAVNARYLLQLNLSSFNQGSHGRFSMLGYRLFQTKYADIRIFIQVWDSDTGSIVWEGVEELTLAEDTRAQKVINFTSVVEASARSLISLLPYEEHNPEDVSQMLTTE
ncbi:MAG: hypothetical protein V7731_11890 [Amphritea sp.]